MAPAAVERRLRLLHLVWFLHPYHFGGSGVSVLHLGTALAARGHDVHFAVMGLAPGTEPTTLLGCPVHGLGARLGHGWVAGAALARLFGLVRRLQPDLIHAHPLAGPSVWAALLKATRGVPLVITDRGSVYSPMGFGRRLLCRWALGSADAVIALSDDMRVRLQSLAPCQPEVIPNGVDPVAGPPRDGAPGGPEPLTLIYGGRLESAKGVDILLDAFATVIRTVPDCRLTLYGDGPDRERFRAQADHLGLNGHVTFRGAVQHEAFTTALARATLLVLPSLREALPRTVLEALACGVPVVASRVGGIPELVTDGEHGLLVPPGDAAALASALVRALEDENLRAAMAKANLARAVHYAWPEIAGRTETVYARVVRQARAR